VPGEAYCQLAAVGKRPDARSRSLQLVSERWGGSRFPSGDLGGGGFAEAPGRGPRAGLLDPTERAVPARVRCSPMEPTESTREGGLLAWQLRGYPKTHSHRRNLLVHATTAPLFLAGTVALVLSPLAGAWLLALAFPAMVLPLVLQGRGHRLERNLPAAFRGPADFAIRLFVEQWVTFPRFVLTGGFARNWRASAPPHGTELGAAPR